MLYFYKSSRKSDKLSCPITICSSNAHHADVIAILKFMEWGYKGSPVRIAI